MSATASDGVGAGTATYTALFRVDKDGWWWAQVVEVPEALSQGRTLDEARANVADALETILAVLAEQGRDVPEPQPVTVSPVTVTRR
jgi:predicted RNase H-like HicB family nuclease